MPIIMFFGVGLAITGGSIHWWIAGYAYTPEVLYVKLTASMMVSTGAVVSCIGIAGIIIMDKLKSFK